MKSYIFPYKISFGKMDSVDAEIECELTEKESKRLVKSANEGGRTRLNDDEDISDIGDKVYWKVVDSEKRAILANPFFEIEDYGDEDEDDEQDDSSGDKIDLYLDSLEISIYYPKELQMLERTVIKKVKQSYRRARIF